MKEIIVGEHTIAGFIHVHPRPLLPPQTIQETFMEKDYALVKTVFFIAKNLAIIWDKQFNQQPRFLAITQADGKLGLAKQQPFNIIPGALSGLTKSLAREWLGVFTRTIDISPQLTFADAARMLYAEANDAESTLLEVGIDHQGHRWQSTLIASETLPAPSKINANTVFVVSGGGRGITAECIVELAKNFQAKFILLGRTRLNENEPDWVQNIATADELKIAVINHLRQLQGKPKPMQINAMVKNILASRAIKDTLKKITNYGGKAIYLSVDITKVDELKNQLELAQKQFGRVNMIIHGAGNLADKKISNKDEHDFSLVFNTKIKGLENLLRIFDPEQIECIMLFSSVAGFFGNMGQTDYAMANEVLNKFAHCFKIFYPEKHVTSINWGPWDSGMIKDELKKIYQNKGIELIPTEIGNNLCVNEFLSSDKPTQLLLTKTFTLSSENTLKKPLYCRIKRKLSVADNSFLQDHVIAGHPVLPVTCAISWMVKNCTDRISPEYQFISLENFKVLKGLIFKNQDAKEYITEFNISPSQENKEKISSVITIYSYYENSRPCFHYSAKINLEKNLKKSLIMPELNLEFDHKIPAPQDKIYSENGFLFHGKSFKGIEKILNIDRKKITVKCRLPAMNNNIYGQFQVNSFNPYISDVCLQGALVYSLYFLSKKCLPAEIKKIEQFQIIKFNQNFYLSLVLKDEVNSSIIFDITAHDDQGEIYQKWTGVKYILKNF